MFILLLCKIVTIDLDSGFLDHYLIITVSKDKRISSKQGPLESLLFPVLKYIEGFLFTFCFNIVPLGGCINFHIFIYLMLMVIQNEVCNF